MRKEGSRTSDSPRRFVWDTHDGTSDGAAQAPASKGRSRVLRPRRLVIGSAVLVLLAGGAYGVASVSTKKQTSDVAGAAALALPSSPRSTAAASASASTRPSPSRSATPSRGATTPATRVVTVVTSVVAAAGDVPAATTSAAAPAAPSPVGDWLLNQTVGNTAVDSTGAHDGTASDGWWAGGACLFDGTDSQIYTDGPVLSTGPGESFTVSAWVDMTALPVAPQYDSTAVSQGADQDSAFYLQFTEPADRWAFARVATDSDNPPTADRALSQNPPSLDTWTHLVGVYYASSGTERLYVNGVAQGSATDTTPFSSSGDLVIGRGLFDGADSDWFKGAIKKVEVFDVALDGSEVAALS